MSLLEKIEKGKKKKPHFLCIYGTPGVGKSSFAADAPNPLFIDIEEGSDNLNVSRIRAKKFDQSIEVLDELLKENHDYKSVVVDSLDHLEPIIHSIIEEKEGKKISKIAYGVGFALALEYWNKFLTKLEILRKEKSLNIILIAHAKVKTFNNPMELEPYDRYELKLSKGAAALITEKVDTLLFANYETFIKKNDDGKVKAIGEGRRVIHTTCMPSYEAKNRFNLPETLPLSWSDFDSAATHDGDRDIEKIKSNITNLISAIKDEKTQEIVKQKLKDAGDEVLTLLKIENRLKELTGNN